MKKLNFESFRKEYTCYDDISDSWLEWFIGLFEGDGSFIITRSNKEIQFVISQYEPNINVLIDIKDKFGSEVLLFNLLGLIEVYIKVKSIKKQCTVSLCKI